MIVREAPDRLTLLRQTDHANLTGEMAAHLREAPAPVSAFVAAARLHDNGWREHDEEAPTFDEATCIPRSYRHMEGAEYREIWGRGIARAAAVDPYVGLLVGLHGMQFFARKQSPEDQAFHETERARQDAVLAGLGLGGTWLDLPSPAREHYEWIRFLDGLSLFFCDAWGSPWVAEVDGVEMRVTRDGDGVVRVDPWPFREPFTLEVEARELPRPRYPDAEAFHADLRRARRVLLACTFAPPGAEVPGPAAIEPRA